VALGVLCVARETGGKGVDGMWSRASAVHGGDLRFILHEEYCMLRVWHCVEGKVCVFEG
jgi:hypothetical protein